MLRKPITDRRTGSGLFDSATQQVFVKLAQKIIPPGESEDNLMNESKIASSVQGVSHIELHPDFKKSDSFDEFSLLKELGRVLNGTDKVCDFIDDKNTLHHIPNGRKLGTVKIQDPRESITRRLAGRRRADSVTKLYVLLLPDSP